MANVNCQLINHPAVRNLPNYVAVKITVIGEPEPLMPPVAILDRHSSVASLLGDAQAHHMVVEIGPATRHTSVDAVCLEIFSGREIREPPPKQ
jgi:hypothetical protein